MLRTILIWMLLCTTTNMLLRLLAEYPCGCEYVYSIEMEMDGSMAHTIANYGADLVCRAAQHAGTIKTCTACEEKSKRLQIEGRLN